MDISQLAGKVVAITGASSGIGLEIAKLLDQNGANLALGAREPGKLPFHKNKVATSEQEVIGLPLDVTVERSVIHFLEGALMVFEKIDVLINCAGTGTFANALDLTADEFDRMVSVNLKGTFLTSKYFAQHMVQYGEGHIINIASIAATTALPGCAGYSASKFGVYGLTKVLQAELRGKGVQVTAVLPGAVDTPFWNTIDPKPDTSKMIPAETLAKHIVYLMCQPKGAYVDEITIMPPLGVL